MTEEHMANGTKHEQKVRQKQTRSKSLRPLFPKVGSWNFNLKVSMEGLQNTTTIYLQKKGEKEEWYTCLETKKSFKFT